MIWRAGNAGADHNGICKATGLFSIPVIDSVLTVTGTMVGAIVGDTTVLGAQTTGTQHGVGNTKVNLWYYPRSELQLENG